MGIFLRAAERQRATDCFYAKKTVTQRKRERGRRGGEGGEREGVQLVGGCGLEGVQFEVLTV